MVKDKIYTTFAQQWSANPERLDGLKRLLFSIKIYLQPPPPPQKKKKKKTHPNSFFLFFSCLILPWSDTYIPKMSPGILVLNLVVHSSKNWSVQFPGRLTIEPLDWGAPLFHSASSLSAPWVDICVPYFDGNILNYLELTKANGSKDSSRKAARPEHIEKAELKLNDGCDKPWPPKFPQTRPSMLTRWFPHSLNCQIVGLYRKPQR